MFEKERSPEHNSILDRIIKNAHLLGRMSDKVDRWMEKPFQMDEKAEYEYKRFLDIQQEQRELLDKLKVI